MKKALAAFAFLMAIYQISNAFNPLGPAYDSIKSQAIESLKGTFNREIKIKSASGIILGQIILNDVQVGNDLFFEKFVINFEQLKYLENRGNIIPSIKNIKIEGGYAKVVLDKKGKLSIADILKTGGQGPALTSKIYLKKIDIYYSDHQRKGLEEKFSKTNGEINLLDPSAVKFAIKASSENINQADARGELNQGNGQFKIRVESSGINLPRYLKYFAPGIKAQKGSARLVLFASNSGVSIDSDLMIDGIAAKIKGKIYKTLDLTAQFSNIDSSVLKKFAKGLGGLDFSGKISGQANIRGNYNNPSVRLSAALNNGKMFGIKGHGSINCFISNGLLNINSAELYVFGGKVRLAPSTLSIGRKNNFSITGATVGLKLPALTSNAVGVLGSIDGNFQALGNQDKFSVIFNGQSDNASLWGERVNFAKAEVYYDNGEIKFKDIALASNRGNFAASGEMKKNKQVFLNTEAEGLRMRGKNAFGKTTLSIKKFSGSISFVLNDEFMKAPIKNLTAKGSVVLGRSFLGEQKIQSAQGTIYISKGRARVEQGKIEQGNSLLIISGETGVGVDTNLIVSGVSLELADFKILNLVLPSEASNPKGNMDVAAKIYGRMEKLDSPGDLFDLSAKIGVSIRNASIGGASITQASLEAELSKSKIAIDRMFVLTERSELLGYYKSSANGKINSRIKGDVDLSDVRVFTRKYGIIKGLSSIDLWINADKSDLTNVEVKSKNVSLGDLSVEAISLKAMFGQGKLYLRELNLQGKDINLGINGQMDFNKNFLESPIAFFVVLKNSNAQKTADLIYSVATEAQNISESKFFGKIKLDVSNLKVSGPAGRNPQFGEVFDYWSQVRKKVEAYKEKGPQRFFGGLSGDASCTANIVGTLGRPFLKLECGVKNGGINKYKYDEINIRSTITADNISIETAEIKKQGGAINLAGSIGIPDLKLELSLLARQMPLDIFTIAAEKSISGRFNGIASVSGDVNSPAYRCSVTAETPVIEDVKYKRIETEIEGGKNMLYLKKLDIFDSNGECTQAIGRISKSNSSLSITFEGSSMGLVNLFNDKIKWLEGDVHGFVRAELKDGAARVYGDLSAAKCLISIRPLGSIIHDGEIEVKADGNRVDLTKFTGSLKSSEKSSPFSIGGYVDLINNSISFSMADCKLRLNVQNLYTGDIAFAGASAYGPIAAPTISSEVSFSNGMLYLSQDAIFGNQSQNTSPNGLNLVVNIGKNVYLTSGNIDTLVLSSILLNMELLGEKIKIIGTTINPEVYGLIYLKRGTISVFNREFSLLGLSDLALYYPYESDKVTKNYAEFSGPILPNLNVSSLVRVPVAGDIDPETKKAKEKEVDIILKFTGIPMSKDMDKALKMKLDAFEADKTQFPSVYKRSLYSEDTIKMMLLPDFIKSAIGIEKSKDIDANAVVADYLSSRIQTYVFRGIERELEQALGLESLTLSYNFGKDLRRSLGSKNFTDAEKQALGVGFVKGFYDKLFIEVKYSQILENIQGNQTPSTFNYAVTYRLTPALSISYYRDPISLNDTGTGDQKLSLKTGMSF